MPSVERMRGTRPRFVASRANAISSGSRCRPWRTCSGLAHVRDTSWLGELAANDRTGSQLAAADQSGVGPGGCLYASRHRARTPPRSVRVPHPGRYRSTPTPHGRTGRWRHHRRRRGAMWTDEVDEFLLVSLRGDAAGTKDRAGFAVDAGKAVQQMLTAEETMSQPTCLRPGEHHHQATFPYMRRDIRVGPCDGRACGARFVW